MLYSIMYIKSIIIFGRWKGIQNRWYFTSRESM